jgi:hypothetical protein
MHISKKLPPKKSRSYEVLSNKTSNAALYEDDDGLPKEKAPASAVIRRNKRLDYILRLGQFITLFAIIVWIVIWSNAGASFIPSSSISSKVGKQLYHTLRKNNSETLVRIVGFAYCQHLRNATFTFTKAVNDLTVTSTIHAIESSALKLYDTAMSSNPDFNEISLLRYACYTSCAIDDNPGLPTDVSLHTLDPTTYFPLLSFKKSPAVAKMHHRLTSNPSCTLLKHYRIVYIIMAHTHGKQEIKHLYEILWEEDVFFLFHIDSKETMFKKDFKGWFKTDPLVSSRCNAAIMTNPFGLQWYLQSSKLIS